MFSKITEKFRKQEGFTLIEILVVIGIIAILATIVIIAINPARQFAQARNSQRTSNVNAILNAVGQNIADNQGEFTCGAGNIPAAATNMSQAAADYDIYDCIVPTYMPSMVCDPDEDQDDCDVDTLYDTGYEISQDANGRITVEAPAAELGEVISVTR